MSTDDIYRALSLRSPKDSPVAENPEQDDADTDTYTTHYLLNKPSTPRYRKSAPPTPSHRVCVVDAASSRLPTRRQLCGLLREDDVDVAPARTRSEREWTGSKQMSKKNSEPPRAQRKEVERMQTQRKTNIRQTYAAIKRDKRRDGAAVLVAVVDAGVVSFLRVSEAGFAEGGALFAGFDGGGGRGGEMGEKGGGGGGTGRGGGKRGGRGRGRGSGRGWGR